MATTLLRSITIAALAVGALAATGCSSSREEAGSDAMTAHVGNYPPGPANAWRPRVGIPPFKVTGHDISPKTTELAADQFTTLAVMSDRFTVIERAQLEQLLNEQGLAGVVKEGEVARQAQIRGVDLLALGKITNLRVKAEKSGGGFNLASLGGHFGLFDINNSKSVITVECGVDIRLVDPSSGAIFAARSADYKRTDSLEAMQVGVLGYRDDAQTDLKMTEENHGKILRLAIDDAIRKMLPSLDRQLVAKASAAAPAAAPAAPAAPPAK